MNAEGYTVIQIMVNLSGLLLGSILTISFSFSYFFGTIRSLELPNKEGKERNPLKPLEHIIKKDKEISDQVLETQTRVNHYLKGLFTVKLARDASHYSKNRLLAAIQEHHFSASIYFVILILLVSALNYRAFVIPAGASVFLMFSLYLMITGAFYTRLKTWTLSIGVIVILVLNYLSGIDGFKKMNFAYGMDYEVEPAPYNYQALSNFTTDSVLRMDSLSALHSLQNWRAKFPGTEKPPLIILNVSGGGLRSSLWTMKILQELDRKSFNGDLMKQVHLVTGSSGGMLGAAYYREIIHQRNLGQLRPEINPDLYLDRIGQDILNPVAYTLAVHDLFFRFRKIEYDGKLYAKDRGYAFDQKFNQNTDFLLDKKYGDYADLERDSKVPTLILSPTIIGDGRRLIMSTQGMSFLTYHPSYLSFDDEKNYDAVEFSKIFDEQGAEDLSFITALRLSASFPYITPLVNLPSEPSIELIDAGVRDNEGLEIALRYLHKFKTWIKDNTGGVIIIQVKANRPDEIPIADLDQTRFDQLTLPITGVFHSFNNLQIYNKSLLTEWSNEILDFPVDVVRFSLSEKKDNASLSWHLTEKEKRNILKSFDNLNNQTELEKLDYLLSSDQD